MMLLIENVEGVCLCIEGRVPNVMSRIDFTFRSDSNLKLEFEVFFFSLELIFSLEYFVQFTFSKKINFTEWISLKSILSPQNQTHG
jgi:hypothetical protein